MTYQEGSIKEGSGLPFGGPTRIRHENENNLPKQIMVPFLSITRLLIGYHRWKLQKELNCRLKKIDFL